LRKTARSRSRLRPSPIASLHHGEDPSTDSDFQKAISRKNAAVPVGRHASRSKTTGDLRLDDRRLGIPWRATASRPAPERIYKPRRGLNDISVLPKSCYRRSLNCDKAVIGECPLNTARVAPTGGAGIMPSSGFVGRQGQLPVQELPPWGDDSKQFT